MATILNETITADGSTTAVNYTGGEGYFTVEGTFGGGTIKLQYTTDNGTPDTDVGVNSTLTAAGGAVLNLPPCKLHVNTSGATTPSVVAKVVIY